MKNEEDYTIIKNVKNAPTNINKDKRFKQNQMKELAETKEVKQLSVNITLLERTRNLISLIQKGNFDKEHKDKMTAKLIEFSKIVGQ